MGYAGGSHMLGAMKLQGTGCPCDFVESRRLLERALRLGHKGGGINSEGFDFDGVMETIKCLKSHVSKVRSQIQTCHTIKFKYIIKL